MYASLQSVYNYQEYETASCQMQYSRTASKTQQLTLEQMQDLVTVQTYIREGSFEENETNEDIFCKSFDQLAQPSLITSYDQQTTDGLWRVNELEPLGFAQTYQPAEGDNPASSSIRCALTSKRGVGQPKDYVFKTGQTIGVRAGYKVRESETALTSIYAYDKD